MAKKNPIIVPDAHRAVNWNEKAVQAVIDEHGYVLVGLKIDGFRAHLYREGAALFIVTRSGHPILAMAEQHAAILAEWDRLGFSPEAVLDTELHLPGVDFETTSGLLRRHTPLGEAVKYQFVILDVLTKDHLVGLKADSPSYGHRLTSISRKVSGTLAVHSDLFVKEATARCVTIADVWAAYHAARKLGYEGVIAKDPSAGIRNGKVAGQWKLKPGCGAPGWEGDGTVIGYVRGEAGKANEGKIVGFRVRLEDGSESNATGLTQAQIAEYTAEVQRVSTTASMAGPFAYYGRLARIEAMERTKAGSLRHPKFVAFRDLDSAPGELA